MKRSGKSPLMSREKACLKAFHSSRVAPVAPRCGREVGNLYPARVREQVGRDEGDPEEVDGETKGARDQAGGVAQQTAAEPPILSEMSPSIFGAACSGVPAKRPH